MITSDLAGVLCQPSRMASSYISSPRSGRIEGFFNLQQRNVGSRLAVGEAGSLQC
jgi:hypothetical protein